MPIVGFKHPLNRKDVRFDHFDTDRSMNGRSPVAPWHARMIWTKIVEDVRHTGSALTATACTSCPRALYIERNFDYTVNPNKRFVMDRGTGMHSVAAEHWPAEHFMTEAEDRDKAYMTVYGELFGVKISALLDVVRRAGPMSEGGEAALCPVEIIDMKFPSDFSVNKGDRKAGRATPEHAVQLNIGRLLLAQQDWAKEVGYDPDTVLLTIYDHALEPMPLSAPHMAEDEMLAVRPWGGQYTIGERLEIIREMWEISPEDVARDEQCTEEDARDSIAAGIPMVGEHDMVNQRGNRCSLYCDVENICNRLVRTYGRPVTTGAEE